MVGDVMALVLGSDIDNVACRGTSRWVATGFQTQEEYSASKALLLIGPAIPRHLLEY